MPSLRRIFAMLALVAALISPQAALAADKSQAMAEHMRLMEAQNPGMMRMMETGMGHMDQAPPFRMPPVHP